MGGNACIGRKPYEVIEECPRCGLRRPPSYVAFTCPSCGTPFSINLRFKTHVNWGAPGFGIRAGSSRRFDSLWVYYGMIPVPPHNVVSLGEGLTPLVRLARFARSLGINVGNIYGKLEGCNPTGSFKDRGMTVGATIARLLGVKAVVVASTGNTSASAAAYAAKAGIKCLVVLPKGKVARGKLAQAALHGAVIIGINGSFDAALDAVMKAAKMGVAYPLNSFNPWRLEGQKTIAYELYEQLGDVPSAVVVPVGNAGNISAIWKGFKELLDAGVTRKLPRMYGVQAEGASPLARMWREGLEELIAEESPETYATAIRIGRPVNWVKALNAVRESRGSMISVSDDEIREAQLMLARLEGVGVEPASAAAAAGVMRLWRAGELGGDDVVVVVLTGHALKDPDAALGCGVNAVDAEDSDEAVKLISRFAGGL